MCQEAPNRKVLSESLSTARISALGILVALCLALAATALPALAVPAAQETPAGPPQPLDGRQSYAQNCAPCHGDGGGGDGPSASGLGAVPTAFADYAAISDLPLTEWFNVTKNGRMDRMMPPWGKRLDDAQIWDTVAYAWTLHTSRPQVEMGKAVYETNCASCHGADGKGTPPMPDFTDFGATSATSQSVWEQVVREGRGNMPAFGDKLGQPEQQAALEYVRSLSLGPMFTEAPATGAGVITGTVTNGSTGAPMPALSVELGVFDGDALVEQRSTSTGADGSYRFDGLPTEPNLLFLARAEYPRGGIPYASGAASFEAGTEALVLPISVYESTTDATGIRADRAHIIVEFEPGQAQIAELIVFSLDGNRAYAGDGSGVLRFTVPPGAQNLSVSDGELRDASDPASARYVRTADGFVDRMPLPPGQGVRQVLYRYSLPYSGQSLDLVRSLAYPAAAVNVLVADQGQPPEGDVPRVSSKELADQGVRSTESGGFYSLLGENIPAGQPITIAMRGLPAAGESGISSSAQASNRPWLFLLIGLVGAGAGALIAWPLVARRSRETRAALPEDSSYGAAGDRERLVDALARLQLAFEAGELSEAAYRDQRMQIKSQLLDLIREEQAEPSGETAR